MKGRVLVVDDDSALAEMLGIVLRSEGFEPAFVADGDKAMEVFRDTKPDLVLLDLMLPGMAASTCAAGSAPRPACRSSCSPPRATPWTSCWAWSPAPTTTS